MAYTVLARKYRSSGFDDVIGQQPVAQTLKNAIKTGRVAHAFLFSGTRGVGKTTMARVLSKALNCLEFDQPTTEPCCKCQSCIDINAGQDVDVIEIDGASNNSVDNIRELRQNAIYRPARSRYKIYIIDEVHMLSNSAFNALLKTLEEPPEHVKFIFATTEPNKVLPTIQSRCQRYDFTNITPADIADRLRFVLEQEQITYDDEIVLPIARMANGSMRDALSLLDRLISTGAQPLNADLLNRFMGTADSVRILGLIEKIADSDAEGALLSLDELITSGFGLVQIIDSLIENTRDLMIASSAGIDSQLLIVNADQLKQLDKLSCKFDIAALVYNITALEKLRWAVKNSDAPRAIMEAGVLRFALAEHFINIDQLLAGAGAQKKTQPPPAKVTKPQARTAQSPAQSQPEPERTIQAANLKQLKDRWVELGHILNEILGPSTYALLSVAKPESFQDNKIVLAFAAECSLQYQMCSQKDKKELIARAFGKALGTGVELQMKLLEKSAQKKQPKPAKSRNNELIEDPAVKMILSEFDGTVTGIQEDTE